MNHNDHDNDPLLTALDKGEWGRTAEDITRIYRYIEQVPFFSRALNYGRIKPNELRDIACHVQVEDVEENQIVFREGDEGDKFYIIFSGEVHVLIDKHESDEMHLASVELAKEVHAEKKDQDNQIEEKETKRKMVQFDEDSKDDPDKKNAKETNANNDQVPMTRLDKDMLLDSKRKEIYLLRKHEGIDCEEHITGCIGMVRIATIQTEGSFGDLALLEDKKRSASVVTKQSCIFLTLSKKDYQRTIAEHEKMMLKNRFATLSKVPIFHNWPKNDIKAVCMLLTEQHVNAGEVVSRQGDLGSNLWIVKTGELRGVKKIKAKELGVGIVGVDLHHGCKVQNPKIHPGGYVFLNVASYHSCSVFGEQALVPKSHYLKSDDHTNAYHSHTKTNAEIDARNSRKSNVMANWHSKQFWENATHRQPHFVIATTACNLLVVSKQAFGRRVQQFSDSLRSGVEAAPTYDESLISHSETTDWKLFKSAVVLDVLKSKKKRKQKKQTGILNFDEVLDKRYRPSNGNGMRNTRFLNTVPDDMIQYLEARKKRREYIKTNIKKKNECAHHLLIPQSSGIIKTNHNDKNVSKEESIYLKKVMRRSPAVPVSPLCKRKLLLQQKHRNYSEELGCCAKHNNQKPIVPTGARKSRNLPSSAFWSLQRWSSRPPLTLEHRRLLTTKEKEVMDRDREIRFKEILAHQIHEGLSTYDNDSASSLLVKVAGTTKRNCLRSTLRLNSVSQMYSIIKEKLENEEEDKKEQAYVMGALNV
jgi:CRP-like cAMP-binding protein